MSAVQYALICVALFLQFLTSSMVVAADSGLYIVYPSASQSINPNTDHYTLALIKLSISEKDTIFQKIFSSRKNGSFKLRSTSTFFDNDELVLERVKVLDNLSRDRDQFGGQVIKLQDNVPADAKMSYTLNVTLYKESRLDSVLKALDESSKDASIPRDLFAAQWVGYTKALSAVLNNLFSLNDASTPLAWEHDVKTNVVNANGVMREHYIIYLAPVSEGDKTHQGLDEAQLWYDEGNTRVMYGKEPLRAWSHVVLKVSKGEGMNVRALVLESKAPWAVLAQSQFLLPTLAVFDNPQQVRAASDTQLKALNDQLTLLKSEHRFSKYDRAVALKGFAKTSLSQLTPACSRVKGDEFSCGISALKQFSENIDEFVGLLGEGKRALGDKLDEELFQRIEENSLDVSNKLLETLLEQKP